MKLQDVEMHVFYWLAENLSCRPPTLLQRCQWPQQGAEAHRRDPLRLSDRIPGAWWLAKIDIYRRGWVGQADCFKSLSSRCKWKKRWG